MSDNLALHDLIKFDTSEAEKCCLLVQVALHFELEAAAVFEQVVSRAADGVGGEEEVCRLGRFGTAVPRLAGQTLRSEDVHLLQVQGNAVQQADMLL